jgi:hypothetical protein
MISLKDIQQNVPQAPRIVIYGVPGIGKTTLAACASNPVFIQTEDGLGTITAPAFPKATSYRQVLEAMAVLINEQHDFDTVILDSLDALEPLLWQHVCEENGKKNIEEFGYGKGFTFAAMEWRRLTNGFDKLRAKGITVVLIGHSQVVRFESPEVDAYDRYQLRLQKLAEATIVDWADAVLFANYRVTAVVSGDRKRGVGDGSRVLMTTERPAFRAKNRYRLPDQIPIPANDPQAGWNQLMGAIADTVS